jgi:hypothetical protein
MRPIICDTNIWYDIANNKINLDILKQVRLIGTSVNITEISSSPNIVNDIDLTVRTIKAFRKNHDFILINNPMEHLISVFHQDYEPNSKVEDDLLKGFELLLNIDIKEIPQHGFDEAKRRLAKINEGKQKLVDLINTGLPEVRERIKRGIRKKNHRKIDFTKTWKKFISDAVHLYSKEYCNKEYIIDIEDENWSKLELFINTWENYFKELDVSKTKIKPNDWADLFNLVYVQPEFYYWTNDEPWNRLFEKNELLLKYQYNYGT